MRQRREWSVWVRQEGVECVGETEEVVQRVELQW